MCRASSRPDPAASATEAVGWAGLAVWPRAVLVCDVCELCDNRTSGTRSVAANQENCITRLIILSILSGNLLQAAKIAMNQPDIDSRRHKQFYVSVIQTCASSNWAILADCECAT
jgi:hypothetical protein